MHPEWSCCARASDCGRYYDGCHFVMHLLVYYSFLQLFIFLLNYPNTQIPFRHGYPSFTHYIIIMIANTLKLVYRYTERALTPQAFSSMLQANILKQPLSQIIHNFNLYDNNINVFDYDYFQQSCYNLLNHQNKMTTSDIFTVLRLGLKHNIKNQMVWKHLQAELYRRLHKKMNPIFEYQKLQADKQIKAIMEKLEKGSQDHFQILTPQFKLAQANQNEMLEKQELTKQQNEIQEKQVKQVLKKRNQDDITKYAFDLVQILIWYGCENIKFLNFLLQTQLHQSVQQNNAYSILRFAELLTYICQVNMKIYEQHKNKYTARSIKGIYRYQGAYFPQLIKSLHTALPTFNNDEIKHLTEVIRSFPIKKRINRKSITHMIAQQWKSRQIGLQEQEKKKLQEILGKDDKLIQKFNSSYGQIQEKQDMSQDDESDQNQEQKPVYISV